MQNNKKALALLSVLFLLTGCGEEKHTHTYSADWSIDANAHWHAATCGHNTKSSRGSHDFGEIGEDNKVTCSVCGYAKDYNPNDVEYSGGFSDVTEFDDSLEIHTDAQKEYLSYTGDYKTMPQASYPDGNKLLSDPNKFTVTWDFDDHESVTKYSVTIGQKEDLSDGFEIMGTKAKSIDMYNLFLGKNYYRINAYLEDGKVGGDVYECQVDSCYPRNLYVGVKMTNCRDTGGRKVGSGATIRQGLLIRTCGNGYAMNQDYIDDEGKTILKDQLKVKTEINLNDSNAYNCALTGTTVYDTFMDYMGNEKSSKHHFSRNCENIKNVFEILANEQNYPVFYHCRIGTDRTGLIAILVNGVLGVSLNEIYQDYLFSNFGKIGNKRKIGAGDEDDITNYMNEIEAMPGSNFQEKCYNALITIGVPRETIAKVQDILLEGTKPTNANGQVVIAAKDMTLSGTTLETVDKSSLVERSKPASCATLSNGAKASGTFTSSGNRAVYVYIGHTTSNTTLKVETSIQVKIDGNALTIPAIDFKNAGMGHNGSRVNYYFVKCGDLTNLTAGEHTFEVSGLANSMSLGNIAIL